MLTILGFYLVIYVLVYLYRRWLDEDNCYQYIVAIPEDVDNPVSVALV